MTEISLNKVNLSFGFNIVLKDLSFDINNGERTAIIGQNGCGKTTAFNLIMGYYLPDSGSVSIRKGSKIGYLKQIPEKEDVNVLANDVYLRGINELLILEKELEEFSNNMSDSKKDIDKYTSLQSEFEIKEGYKLKEKINKIKNGFKLSDELLNTPYNKLSGGEKTIINLASLILSNPDILLLDEPTNHLDIETLEWFEEYLKSYKGTVLVISHDRYFLDNVVNKIICLENNKCDIYYGNYSYYTIESEKRMLLEFQNYKNQQKKITAMKKQIKLLHEWGVRSDNPAFFRREASIQKRLDKMELVDKPAIKKDLRIDFNSNIRSGNDVLIIKNYDLSIGSKELLSKVNLKVSFKSRVCLMGRNGSGKTTLINKIIENNTSNILIGSNVSIGYIPQEIRFDDENQTIYEYARGFYTKGETELRSELDKFYFANETINKKIKYISGGEKVRLKLMELLINDVNLLILDEPTNHIDIDTKEIIEESLLSFNGTIIFISHDRYFVNKIATSIVRIENKKLIEYSGNYDYYLSKKITPQMQEETKEKEININGSNRLKEYLKDSIITQENNKCSLYKEYKIRKKSKVSYLKIANHLSKESISLEYLDGKILCPKKIFYEKYNGLSYILMSGVEGKPLDDIFFLNNPHEGIDIIVEAFNNLYNVDYSDCVIDQTIDSKIKEIECKFNQIDENLISREMIDRYKTKECILSYIKGNKPKQIIGFTHGNMSLDNIYGLHGHFSGLNHIIDAGISDIYFDIVICELSIEKSYGKEYVSEFYEKLGIERDSFKSNYYKILYSLYKM